MTRPKSLVRRIASGRLVSRARLAGPVLLAGPAVLALSSCASGAIGANTPAGSGQSFVGASYSSTYYSPGSRPLAPDIHGRTLTGQSFRLSQDRGDVVVLNFWGSWCTPCRREAPALAALATRFTHAHVRFMGDNVLDYTASAVTFERQFNVRYPSLSDHGEQIVLAFHNTVPPNAIPSTLVIDRTGHIAARVVGEATYAELKALIVKVLAGGS